MSKNKLIIAAAGSGKTTHLVKEALKVEDGRVLITTYTQANEAEIRKKIVEINKCIPEHITVQTWFSFLLKHGARPFQGILFEKKIKGMILVNSQSGFKGRTRYGQPIYFGEGKDFEHHYFSNSLKIYSDKLSKFVFRCNEKTKGLVIDRISKIYSHIFVDEVQDLAGYDLELLKHLFVSNSSILLVGDPRQGTYSTNTASKNKKYRKANIAKYFFQDDAIQIETDRTSLQVNYRSNKEICNLSNKLFSGMIATSSGNQKTTDHDGVFLVKESDIVSYLKKFEPVQLRDSKRKEVHPNYSVMNFGESKGLSFDRVLIYPTKAFLDWLNDNNSELAETSRSKIYVAITRARYSVGIVVNDKYARTSSLGIYLPG
ncbi:UvrD-helicase domain-containing protein [uncultured Draconibacterium sp.]|uniref:UvrD-helicase domain-containing protein n=1 Tax=uncultured Draconibacterium sp. TaxID=1573823 RepID=UPI0029C9727A|nr:UvrD-helicase domain-containing protein [uncultured Draconibacterium sp.]